MKTKTLITEALFAAIIAVFSRNNNIYRACADNSKHICNFSVCCHSRRQKKAPSLFGIYTLRCGGAACFQRYARRHKRAFRAYRRIYPFIYLYNSYCRFFMRQIKNKPLHLSYVPAVSFICYAGGTIQYILITNTPLQAALVKCVYPFIALDII